MQRLGATGMQRLGAMQGLPDRADARGWRTFVPSEPRSYDRGHTLVFDPIPETSWAFSEKISQPGRARNEASHHLSIAPEGTGT